MYFVRYLQHITNKCTIYLILIVYKKTPTCFEATMHHLQGVLLLYQSYVH
jgi:hypothetical protein